MLIVYKIFQSSVILDFIFLMLILITFYVIIIKNIQIKNLYNLQILLIFEIMKYQKIL